MEQGVGFQERCYGIPVEGKATSMKSMLCEPRKLIAIGSPRAENTCVKWYTLLEEVLDMFLAQLNNQFMDDMSER